MTDNFEESLLKATDLELNQRDRYVKSFENEYRVSHPLDALVEATSNDIGNKACCSNFNSSDQPYDCRSHRSCNHEPDHVNYYKY